MLYACDISAMIILFYLKVCAYLYYTLSIIIINLVLIKINSLFKINFKIDTI